jgi:inosine-uridine nucleoside N-ribohydrolase
MPDQKEARRAFVVVTDATALGDDGVAISMLLAHPEVDVKLIVCASGNVWADEVEGDVRGLLQRLNRLDVPICVASPNEPYPGRIEEFNRQSKVLPPSYEGAFAKPCPSGNDRYLAGLRMFADVVRSNERINLFIIAPPTPVAALLREMPELKQELSNVFVMGGALAVPGNTTKYAEFNFWFDPRSAADLLASGLNLTLLPLDATASLSYSIEAVVSSPSHKPAISYLKEYIKSRQLRNKTTFPLWDEALAGVVLQPGLAQKILLAELEVVRDGRQMGRLKRIDDGRRTKIKVLSHIEQKRLGAIVMESLLR